MPDRHRDQGSRREWQENKQTRTRAHAERLGKHMARALVHTPPTPNNSRHLSRAEGVQHKHTLEAEFVQTNGC